MKNYWQLLTRQIKSERQEEVLVKLKTISFGDQNENKTKWGDGLK